MSEYIMALDPSKRSTGYAVIKAHPEVVDGKEEQTYHIEDSGIILTTHATNPLGYISSELSRILRRHPEIELVIPKESMFNQNYRTTKTLASVHSVVKQVLHAGGYDFVNVNPAEVKRAVGGHGQAPKEQVADGVRKYCNLPPDYPFLTDDVSDAVAVGLTYLTLTKWRDTRSKG